ncbi:tRNA lysidine(34) synthetase TilS [Hydrocarboniphaga sp.]|uniref:tRNA lysidine(34) synthetase TilS n=1 Tax=Hydrocarboniphaga sp. TaxID=2033016 RepID=UPI003D14DB9C
MRGMRLTAEQLLSDTPLPEAAGGVLVAYSGGLDSVVMLHLLGRLRDSGSIRSLRALHVHHGLQAVADDWVRHCAAQCERHGIDLQVLRVQIDGADPAGPEGAARRERYAALSGAMGEGEVLATAHQLDDQAETFLMRALRGSGQRGLAAMRGLQTFGPGWLWRPLLGRSRAELEAYARAHELQWIDDPHNTDPRYERSWLRQQLTPLMRRRWPAATLNLARSAALSAEADDLLAELASIDEAVCAIPGGLSCAALLRLSPARRRNLLRARVDALALPPPPHALLLRLDDLLLARQDAMPLLHWPGGELRRYRDLLAMMPALPEEPGDWQCDWDGRGLLMLPAGCGELHGEAATGRALQVRFARGGERIVMHEGGPHRSLKHLFQEHAVPPWRRRRTPLLFDGGELLWIGGLPAAGGADAAIRALKWRPA